MNAVSDGRVVRTANSRAIFMQRVPDQLRADLQDLVATHPKGKPLAAALIACSDAGWSARALADAIGRKPGAVGGMITRGRSRAVRPEAPFAIPAATQESRYVQVALPDAVVAHLRQVKQEASGLRGKLSADDPRRLASAHFAADTNTLVNSGYPVAAIARAMGVRHRAITQRLERYGFRIPAPTASVCPSPVVPFADLPPLHQECPTLRQAIDSA